MSSVQIKNQLLYMAHAPCTKYVQFKYQCQTYKLHALGMAQSTCIEISHFILIKCLDGIYNIIHIHIYAVSKCSQAGEYLCIRCYSFTAWKGMATGEKEPRPGSQTRGLRFNAEFPPCEPSIWPRFLISNLRRYGHGRAVMLRPLRTHAWGILCAVVRSEGS